MAGGGDLGQPLIDQGARGAVDPEEAAEFERVRDDVELVDRQRTEVDRDRVGLADGGGLMDHAGEDVGEVGLGGGESGGPGEGAGGFDVVGVEPDEVAGFELSRAVNADLVEFDLAGTEAEAVGHEGSRRSG